MFGRILDVLSLDTRMMAASTKLFVAKEDATRNLRELADEVRCGVKGDVLAEDEEIDKLETDDACEAADDELEEGMEAPKFWKTVMEEVRKEKEAVE